MKVVRGLLIATGCLGAAYAVSGALTDPDLKLFGTVAFLAGVLIAHDAVLMPIIIAVGALVGRVLPGRTGAPIRVALVVSLAVLVVALPLVLGYGRSADNPSVLPLRYGLGLIEILGAVWLAALVAVALRARRRPVR